MKAVEAKAETFLDRPLTKPLLRCLVEKGGYRTLHLKPKPDQFDGDMLDEGSVVVSSLITVTAIYKGNEHPSLLVRVDKIEIKKAPPREKPEVRALCEDDDDSCTSDFCGMKGILAPVVLTLERTIVYLSGKKNREILYPIWV